MDNLINHHHHYRARKYSREKIKRMRQREIYEQCIDCILFALTTCAFVVGFYLLMVGLFLFGGA